MPDNRSGILYASGAVALALALRFLPNPCPLEALKALPETSFTDPKWGIAKNVAIASHGSASIIWALEQNAAHRLIKTVDVPARGAYRVSVDTEYDGSQGLMIETGGGAQQKSGRVILNLKTGQIVERIGDVLAAGTEPIGGGPLRRHWWVDMDYVAGPAVFSFTLLDRKNSPIFYGTDSCRVIIGNPAFIEVTH
jgi:hypothetical protein